MSSNGTRFFVTIITPKGSTAKRVDAESLCVGRAEDCDLRIENPSIGRRHLSFLMKDGRTHVEDHASTNGTFVNGIRLEPHVPMLVTPNDQIQLGQSGVRLNVTTESKAPALKKSIPIPTPAAMGFEDTVIAPRKVSAPPIVRTPTATDIGIIPAIPVPSGGEASDRLLMETQKKASAILQEAEMQAERKVEEVYKRAEEARFKGEQVYQKKLNEAFREAEQIYQKAQTEATQILESARLSTSEIRAQAEAAISERRRLTEEDCERALEDAQKTARELKENRLLEADEIIRVREQELLRDTREQMSGQLLEFEKGIKEESERRHEALASELQGVRNQIEETERERDLVVARFEREIELLSEKTKFKENQVETIEQKISMQTELLKSLTSDSDHLQRAAAVAKEELDGHQLEIKRLETLRAELQKQTDESQSKLVVINESQRTIAKRLQAAQENNETELLKIKEQFESSKVALFNQEKEHLEQLRLDTSRKLLVTEQQMYNELVEKKTRIAREIAFTVENFFKQHPEEMGRSSKALQNQLINELDAQIVTLSKDPTAKAKGLSLQSLKRVERWRIRLVGAACGAVLLWAGESAYVLITSEVSPLQRRVAAVAEERKRDLEKRKFNPPQSPEVRGEYTDCVIYTEGFVAIYLDNDFQKKFLQALSPYMFKTWRLEEDKTIQVIAAAGSLVKELAEKKENIHPDFIKKDVQKLHELESQTVQRMSAVLGSQVRYESFKKFEKQFFENYRAQQHAKPKI